MGNYANHVGKLPAKNLHPKADSHCENCTDRCVGCHATCEKYTEWKEDWIKKRIERNKAHNAEKAVNDYQAKVALKIRRSCGDK